MVSEGRITLIADGKISLCGWVRKQDRTERGWDSMCTENANAATCIGQNM